MTKARALLEIPRGVVTKEEFLKNWRLVRRRLGTYAKPSADDMDEIFAHLLEFWAGVRRTPSEFEWDIVVENASMYLFVAIGMACTGAGDPAAIIREAEGMDLACLLVVLRLADREANREDGWDTEEPLPAFFGTPAMMWPVVFGWMVDRCLHKRLEEFLKRQPLSPAEKTPGPPWRDPAAAR